MNRTAVAQELVRIADDLLTIDSPAPADPIDILAQYTADIGRELMKLRRQYGIKSIRQGYKGTGRQRARRQLYCQLSNDRYVDVWLENTAYQIGGVMPGIRGSFPYSGRSPAENAKDIAEMLKKLVENQTRAASTKTAMPKHAKFVSDAEDAAREAYQLSTFAVSNEEKDTAARVHRHAAKLYRIAARKVDMEPSWDNINFQKMRVNNLMALAQRHDKEAERLEKFDIAGKRRATASSKIAMPVYEKAPNFDATLREFIAYCQQISDTYMDQHYSALSKEQFSAMEGGRYVRIVRSGSSSRSVHVFIDKTNGDILKAASWNAPAKWARGNIFDRASWKTIGPYGASYLR